MDNAWHMVTPDGKPSDDLPTTETVLLVVAEFGQQPARVMARWTGYQWAMDEGIYFLERPYLIADTPRCYFRLPKPPYPPSQQPALFDEAE